MKRNETETSISRSVRAAACTGAVALAIALTAAGCQQDSGSSSQSPSPTAAAARVPTPTNYQVLRKGSREINFLVLSGGTISVHDVTADKLVYRAQVPPQTLVRIDPKTGVFVGESNPIKKPLPEKNVRELRLERPAQ